MAGVHTKEQRSFNMSQIRGKDTKPEMLVKQFRRSFYQYSHARDLLLQKQDHI